MMNGSKPQSKMRVHAVYIYPIKGLRGCSPPSLTATATGFSYDRRFLVQQLSSGKHLSVAKFPEIALFVSELAPPPSPSSNPTTIRVRYTKDHTFDKPDQKVDDEILEVPLVPDWKKDGLEEVEYNMHSSPTTGYEMPKKYSEWFSERLGYAARLVYIGENRRKVLGTVSPNVKADWSTTSDSDTKSTQPPAPAASQGWMSYAASTVGNIVSLGQNNNNNNNTTTQQQDEFRHKGVDQGIGFADVAPFLVVSTKSYENAAARLPPGEELDITKFRPNIIVEGAEEAWEEDYWAGLSFGDDEAVQIAFTSNCARCASLNVDYATGKPGLGEAGKILKLLSKDRRVDKGTKWSPIFGRYGFLVCDSNQQTQGEGEEVEIRVGDVVNVVERNTERTRFQWPGLSTDK